MTFEHFKDIIFMALCSGVLKEMRDMQKVMSSLNEKVAKLLQGHVDLKESHKKLEKRVDRMESKTRV
jgi:phage shock protein A